MRSGRLHFLASGCRFIPELSDDMDFAEMKAWPDDELLQTELSNAAGALEDALKSLLSSVSGGVNYFELLVTAFTGLHHTR